EKAGLRLSIQKLMVELSSFKSPSDAPASTVLFFPCSIVVMARDAFMVVFAALLVAQINMCFSSFFSFWKLSCITHPLLYLNGGFLVISFDSSSPVNSFFTGFGILNTHTFMCVYSHGSMYMSPSFIPLFIFLNSST